MIQTFIVITGLMAVWLSQDRREHRRRFACFFGLSAQPAWMYTAFVNEQWGIFALSFVYAYAWGRGLINHWLTNNADN